jgi:hypothetical protein
MVHVIVEADASNQVRAIVQSNQENLIEHLKGSSIEIFVSFAS